MLLLLKSCLVLEFSSVQDPSAALLLVVLDLVQYCCSVLPNFFHATESELLKYSLLNVLPPRCSCTLLVGSFCHSFLVCCFLNYFSLLLLSLQFQFELHLVRAQPELPFLFSRNAEQFVIWNCYVVLEWMLSFLSVKAIPFPRDDLENFRVHRQCSIIWLVSEIQMIDEFCASINNLPS